ncbi:MAG: UDP-2,3-diacylglucosamine diphosphatase LpxI [Candidatus Aminicenantes bacterium]|nr:UDP-2,3-diacylglucosamine diphosphatase LpxI [Candidatus Aminicenantes bacterium]
MADTIGFIAGESQLPLLAVRAARRQGKKIIVAAIKNLAVPELAVEADAWAEFSIGQLGAVIRFFRKYDVHQALMVGRVNHAAIFSIWKADGQFIRFLAKVKDKTTTSLLATLADYFSGAGIEIIDSTFFLRDYLVAAKNYTPRHKIGKNLALDIEFGWEKAWGIAGLDIGQTICVKNRAVVAVEAMEGTDRAIARAAEIAGPGLVVIKVSRPNHDMRFDVPVAGLSTMNLLHTYRAAAFVLEADKTLMLDQPQIIALAQKAKILLMGKK